MIPGIFAIFLVLHGMVHVLYAAQSRRMFELQPGMLWPDGSWAFTRLLGNEGTRLLGTVLLGLGAVLFAASGAGLLLRQGWWRPAALTAAAASSLIFILLWDGGFQDLPGKGAIGILINAAISAAIFLLPQLKIGA